MRHMNQLRESLNRIDGNGYGAYKSLKDTYDFETFRLRIEYVQGDPFASPSQIIVSVPQSVAGFPEDTYRSEYGKSREIALRDYLARQFHTNCKRFCKGDRGSGKSGKVSIDSPGQEILERTAVLIDENEVEVRFAVGLPAFGRKVAGKHAIDLFFKEIPEIVNRSLLFENLDADTIYTHVKTCEDADFIRDSLSKRGLIAFIPEGAILPRESGISHKPLDASQAVPFSSPDSLKVEFDRPNNGVISGMGVLKGITLIVGGGYHGKSTILNALELGIYNHIPYDGREFVVADSEAVKIRAEDGRRIEKTHISPFISNLPFGKDTTAFCSENASGSTSQAANIIEALEAGAHTLLIDEDTSATNFMIRDKRMQELVAKDKEPITPFIDKARQLYDDHGVSSILVIGGSGDYFGIADKVIAMEDYVPHDLTEKAWEIAKETVRDKEGGNSFGEITGRVPLKESVDASKGGKMKIKTRGLTSIEFGMQDVELDAVEQLVDESQTKAIAKALYYARKYMDGNTTLRQVLEKVDEDIRKAGLDVIQPKSSSLASFRKAELAAALNRLRSLQVKGS